MIAWMNPSRLSGAGTMSIPAPDNDPKPPKARKVKKKAAKGKK
jgi:hypothetical protein